MLSTSWINAGSSLYDQGNQRTENRFIIVFVKRCLVSVGARHDQGQLPGNARSGLPRRSAAVASAYRTSRHRKRMPALRKEAPRRLAWCLPHGRKDRIIIRFRRKRPGRAGSDTRYSFQLFPPTSLRFCSKLFNSPVLILMPFPSYRVAPDHCVNINIANARFFIALVMRFMIT
jgi:hypothetical protein